MSSLLSILVIGFLGWRNNRATLTEQVFSRMLAIRRTKAEQLAAYFHTMRNQVEVLGQDDMVSSTQEHSGRAELNNFHAHIYFPPEQIYVSQAEGVFCGVRISTTGHLIKRTDYKPRSVTTEEEWHPSKRTVPWNVPLFRIQSRCLWY